MSKKISDVSLIELQPPSISEDEGIQAVATALDIQLQDINDNTGLVLLLSMLGLLPWWNNLPLKANLVSLYHLDGNNKDAMSNNHGTRYGTGTPFDYVDQQSGSACGKFNGIDDYITIPSLAADELSPAHIGLLARINPSVAQWGTIISRNNPYAIEMLADRTITFGVFCGGWTFLNTTDKVPLNDWTQIFCTYAGTDMKIYFNAVLKKEQAHSIGGNMTQGDNRTVYIGYGQPGLNHHFAGLIDEVAIFDRALLASEITTINERQNAVLLGLLGSDVLDLLAWQFHVDTWSSEYTLDRKREKIKTSLITHTYKGTVWAVEEALRLEGYYDITIDKDIGEWWEFNIEVEAAEGVSPLDIVLDAIENAKNLRSKLLEFKVNFNAQAALTAYAAVGVYVEL